ncbi:MAG: DUF2218 domain-containing protein [Steroidobacteraceae bacterium]
MSRFEGEATTDLALRIVRRLCKHWSHKYPTHLEDSSGTIQLSDVLVTLRAEPDRVHVSLENPHGEVPERLKGVVAEHMQRMAGPEVPLDVRWI